MTAGHCTNISSYTFCEGLSGYDRVTFRCGERKLEVCEGVELDTPR